MKKAIAALVAAVAVGGLATPAFAEYGSQPGYDNAITNSGGCADTGAFGAFGANGDVVHDFGVNYPGSNEKPGATGYQTGLNNSAVCGSR